MNDGEDSCNPYGAAHWRVPVSLWMYNYAVEPFLIQNFPPLFGRPGTKLFFQFLVPQRKHKLCKKDSEYFFSCILCATSSLIFGQCGETLSAFSWVQARVATAGFAEKQLPSCLFLFFCRYKQRTWWKPLNLHLPELILAFTACPTVKYMWWESGHASEQTVRTWKRPGIQKARA